ncbi:MAG: SCP2 sterol-binding domain-containing protein [Nocardioidaceae bacterium]
MSRALTSVAQLVDLPDAAVEAWFAEEDPERIVALVDHASDADLAVLIEHPQVRATAVRTVLGRLGEFAVPERLASIRGVVAFHVDLPKGGAERHALLFDGGVCLLEEPRPADVTITLGAREFVRLVSGGVNAAILLLADRLRVDGDELLALAVGGVFTVPGRAGVAVDPAEVDPEEVAVVLRGAKDAHLRRVMSGGFREVVLEQVFTRLPDYLDERKAAGHALAVGFTVTGRPDGGADRWTVHVADGRCTVQRDADGDARDATLVLDGGAFLKLVTGHLSPVLGVMRGQLKVRGDLGAALTLHKIMRIPGQG